jgi:hypothetical protein
VGGDNGSISGILTKRFTLRHASAAAPTGMVVLHTVLLILIGLFALPWVQGAWAGPSTDQLSDGIDRVVKILRDPELRGDTKVNERRVAVNKVADEIFDFGETAKWSLGQHWPSERRLEFPRRSANSMRESLGRTPYRG